MEESVFDLSPEKLDRLLSIGTDGTDPTEDEEHDEQTNGQGTGCLDRGPSPAKSRSEDVNASLAEVVEQTGGWIGQYKLLSVLGEGGMGIVYLAEQKRPITRRVALKVIKPGMDSKHVIARFEAERQALALLDHPNIARVYDAGTTQSGRPYFVMEYVKGLPITDYCDHHILPIKDRLDLFLQICQAVHHAHQKGIIHRDIKPSNVLVSVENDRPIPKIIDFGVAKAIAQPLIERTHQTEESQLLGTPEYMSPEQADMVSEDIDTRSDVYSLGVLLYVLLTGVLPFDPKTLREGGIQNIRKTIRETDPKTPSTRLTSLGDEAAKVVERRGTEISTLAKHLKNELEWIPLKAMRKERSERYRSASELADDIENYLKGEPLIAGPPTGLYRLKKFVRRNALLSTAILAVAVTLFLGLATTTAMYFRAERLRVKAEQASQQAQQAAEKETAARAEAERFWAQAEVAAKFLVKDILGEEGFVEGPDSDLYHALDITAEKLKNKLVDKPLAEAIIREALGETYHLEMDKPELAIQHLERAYQICLHQLGPDHERTIASTRPLGFAYVGQGRYDDALRLWNEQLEMIQKVYGDEHRLEVLFMINIGGTYTWAGKCKEGEEILVKALEINERVFKWPFYLEKGSTHLARNYLKQGRYDKAAPLLHEVVESQILRFGETDRYTQKSITDLITLYEAWNKPEKANEWRAKMPEDSR